MNHIEQWQKYSVYQIYPLSFQDSNGDGIGDILGIIKRLEHIKNLGIDVIWLSPIYASPMDDNGYDISDYYQINPMFGTMDDFVKLLAKVHELGMKLIMDLVVNHTSDEHIWFLESQKSIDNPYRDYYIWRKDITPITSVFSGSAWENSEKTNEYYFHLFSKRQPDLNWQNESLRKEIYKMINYWLDLGVDGFRLDVIDLIGKDVDSSRIGDGPFLNQYLEEMYLACFKGRDVFTVGEMPSLSIERTREITDLKNGYLKMIFHFGHLGFDEIPGKGKWALKQVDYPAFFAHFEQLQHDLYQTDWNSLFFENHDQPRSVSRYGSIYYREESSKMLMTYLYSMQGTPYIYQGQEIGMSNIRMQSIQEYKDIETINMYNESIENGIDKGIIMNSIWAKARDNARTPYQWDNSRNAGFSTSTPWLSVNPNYPDVNAFNDIKNPFGIYHYLRELLSLRKKYDVFIDGDFQSIPQINVNVAVYKRTNEKEQILVIASFENESKTIHFEKGKSLKLLLSNYPEIEMNEQTIIPPFFTGIYLVKR